MTTVAPTNRRSTLPFFRMTLAIMYLALLPAVLATWGVLPGLPDQYMVLAPLAILSPTLAACWLSRLKAGGPGVRALLGRLGQWRVGIGWYLLALLGFAGIHLASKAIYEFCGGLHAGNWLYFPANAQRITAMVVIPLAEEIGWRGFALPKLLQSYKPLPASLWLGAGWAVWHVPMFILQGFSPDIMVVSFAMLLFGSLIFTWLFLRTRGSLVVAVVAHLGVHLDNPSSVAPGNNTPLVVYTCAMVAVGLLTLLDRKIWRSSEGLSEG